jgi:hypothetical protein
MDHPGNNGGVDPAETTPTPRCGGIYCAEGELLAAINLRLGQHEQEMAQLRAQDEHVLEVVLRAEKAAIKSHTEAAGSHASARASADILRNIEKAVCAPANEAIRRYSDGPLMDADNPIGEETRADLETRAGQLKRIRKEQQLKEEAERERIRLEAEKLVAERHATDLAEAKVANEKRYAEETAERDRRHKVQLAILGAVTAFVTLIATALALLPKIPH